MGVASGGDRRGYLSIRDVSKAYDGHVAVQNLHLEVGVGEFVALLGPSGCGKTTLLRCVAGLIKPNGGDILIDGSSVLSLPANRRDVGLVFQSYALFPHMTVAQNVAFGLRMRGVPKPRSDSIVEEALSSVRLPGFGGRYPHQLSGGEQQRAALARAIVTRPKVLLLDEPLGSLDAKLREAMQVELRQLQRRLGLTTLLVTHDQQEALAMADRIAVMRRGRVEQFDAPRAIYYQPRTPFVAEFIGQMNRFSGTVVDADARSVRLRADEASVEIRAKARDRFAIGNVAIAMVRPERVNIGRPGSAPATCENSVAGRVAETIFSGDRTLCYIQTTIGVVITVLQSQPAPSGEEFPIGSDVSVSWSAEDAHVFPGGGADGRSG